MPDINVAGKKIGEDDARLIVSLFEMTQRATRADTDEFTKNEGVNATTVLFRLLAKHELTLADIPEIQRWHAENEAARATTAAGRTTASSQPNALELVHHILKEHIDVQPHEYVGLSLWILHAHVFNHFEVTPRLALLSPVRNCGKTNALKVVEKLTPDSKRYTSITAATLFRVIDAGAATTLLLDEGDLAGLKIDRVLKQVLNDGYERGGHVARSPGGIRREYSVYSPMGIAAIGTLPLPLLSRSIVIIMHRSKRDNLVTKEQLNTPEQVTRLEGVRRLIFMWAQSISAFDKNPKLPKILRGRTADNWRVLIAIADSFNNTYWSEVARDAAVKFAAGYHDEDACVALLTDIRTIFDRRCVDRLKSLDLAQQLHQLEDGMGIWNAWCGDNDDQAPHAISQGEIATLLRRFSRTELRPRPLFDLGSRNSRGAAGRGYYRSQFEPWWEIYCSERTNAEVRQLHQTPEAEDEAGEERSV
jgi:hypothetical protein